MSNASSKTTTQPVLNIPLKHAAWGPAAAIIVTLIAFIVGQVIGGVIISLLPSVLGWSGERADAFYNSVGGQFVFVLLSEAFIMLLLGLFMWRRKIRLSALGFSRRPQWKDLGLAVLCFGIYMIMLLIVTALAGALLHVNVDQKQELGFDAVVALPDKVMAFVSLVLLPPFVEETIFRGFLYTGLRAKFHFVWATILVSLMFGFMHIFESSNGLLWIAAIDTFLVSIFLCYLRERTGSLWASIMLHALKNGIAFCALYIFV